MEWAVKGGADFIVAETFVHYGESVLALEAIKKYGNGKFGGLEGGGGGAVILDMKWYI